MINVRNSLFETNSSSMHSMVLVKNNSQSDESYFWASISIYGKCVLYTDDLIFGRYPFEILSTFVGKLKYAIASFGKSKFKELEKLAIKYIKPGDWIKHCEGIELPRLELEDNRLFYGSIDHQSAGLLQNYLKTNNLTLEQWLTNKNEIVIIDGDEFKVFEKMSNIGIIDSSNIVRRYRW